MTRLQDGMATVNASAAYLEALAKQTSEPFLLTRGEAPGFLLAERTTWSQAVKASGASFE